MLLPVLLVLLIIKLTMNLTIGLGHKFHFSSAGIFLMLLLEFVCLTLVLLEVEWVIITRTKLMAFIKKSLFEEPVGKVENPPPGI